MHPRHLLQLSGRSVHRYRRRFAFLVTVCVIGFGVTTVVTSIRDGMVQSVSRSAENHYAGHVFVLGFDKQADTMGIIDEGELVERALLESGLEYEALVRRTVSHRKAVIYFQGRAVPLKDVFGVSFEDEQSLFSNRVYASGRFTETLGTDAIILSQAVAAELGVQLGDRVIVEAPTRALQTNTADFVVAATLANPDIFTHFTAYVHRRALNRLLQLPQDAYSTLGIYLSDTERAPDAAAMLYPYFSQYLHMSPPITEKNDLTFFLSQDWDGVRHSIVTLQNYISQVTDLLSAVTLVSYALYGMILLIVCAAALVTYQMILDERSRELATMRALGMGTRQQRVLLLLEGMLVVLASAAGGLTLAFAANVVISYVSFDWIPGFEIFLQGGRLLPHYRGGQILLNALGFMAVLVSVVTLQAVRVTRLSLPHQLSGAVA